jgi:hypothetical protein
MPELGRFRWKFLFVILIYGQKFIQLPETFLVSGQPGIQPFVTVSELNADLRSDLLLPAKPDEIRNAHGGVDVGQCQLPNTALYGQFHQSFGRQGAVSQTAI